jgi:hypothetical protein
VADQEDSSTPTDELGALLALMEAPRPPPEPKPKPDPKAGPRGPFLEAFDAWVQAHGVKPGGYPAATTEDLFRHFEWWAVETRGAAPAVTGNAWGRALTGLGLPRGRKNIKGRDTRPRLMEKNAAQFFNEWVEVNPLPKGESAFAVGDLAKFPGSDPEGESLD